MIEALEDTSVNHLVTHESHMPETHNEWIDRERSVGMGGCFGVGSVTIISFFPFNVTSRTRRHAAATSDCTTTV